ncbi:hypothetical protein I6A84_43515 [Frankia sp. CNm7]|uniref:Integral membrane protein n=1 Tax=Frankia nepalensis TaxID=1836974 RepID=A0A937RFA1_9ACTN|nr:hypothetical protein [Frankia nepalensis]MBL7502548.1 hypothetical protein [Frankia nepalensis]MBL7511736.1 hypothetical protein [Frankia nepalensis]MBL7524734.1 hypothetical protein [Frankia nepalensis]MBL7629122.1 hypothetical protein [Frankia nepalensis]
MLKQGRRVAGGGDDREPAAEPGGGPRHRASGRGTGPRGTGPRSTGPRGTGTGGGRAGRLAGQAGADVLSGPGGGRPAGEVRRLLAVAVGMALLVGMLTSLYGWTVTGLSPHGLPVLAAGPAEPARALAAQLSDAEPGALRVTVVADGEAADRALRAREAYAAFVLGPGGLSLHVASAASPAVSEAMRHAMAQVAPNADIPVVDVVPNAPADHVGGGLSAGYLPMVLVIAAGGVLLARATPRRSARLAGLVGLSAAAGTSGAAALRYGLDVLPGSYWAVAGVLTLLGLSVAGTVLGLGARAGTAGLAGGFVFFVVVAALSAWSSAPELMAPPWGTLGQLAPPGAGVTLLRSAAYFHGAGGGDAAAVLTVWAALGLALVMVGDTRGWLGGGTRGGGADGGAAADQEPAGFPGIPLPAATPVPEMPGAPGSAGTGGAGRLPEPARPGGGPARAASPTGGPPAG